jgi:hypothetical protein
MENSAIYAEIYNSQLVEDAPKQRQEQTVAVLDNEVKL